jgi:hypothetical protein
MRSTPSLQKMAVEETMFDPECIQRCDFCKTGRVTTRNELIAFRQWTNKGYVFCRAKVPVGICSRCGLAHWNKDSEAIVEDAFQQEYKKLLCS